MREGIIFYESWYRAINTLPAKEKLKAYDALFRYALYGEEPDIQTAALSIFIMAKPLVDKNNQNYENGKRGGRKKAVAEEPTANRTETETEPKANQTETEVEAYVNVNIKDKDNVKDKKQRFTPPTLQQVEEYCKQRGNNVNPATFIDFYQSKNWMVGSNKMKDWRACIRTWEQRDRASPKSSFTRIPTNTYDFEELERGLLGE